MSSPNTVATQRLTRTIGMDIHPKLFSAACLTGNKATNAKQLWLHDAKPVDQLEIWAKKHLKRGDVVVMEAGSNSFEICRILKNKGAEPVVLESVAASRVSKGYLKNDKVDAVKLAKVYLSGLCPLVWQPDEQTTQRREIFYMYSRAVCDSVRCRNRLRSWISGHRLKLNGKLQLTSSDAQERVMASRNWSQGQSLIIQNMFEDMHHAQKKRKRFEKEMARQVTGREECLRLLTLCGLRHITIFAIKAIVGNISRFSNAKKLVAYAGLNPRVRQSGNSSLPGKLMRHGRADLRSLLVQGAQAILRQDPKTNKLARWGQKMLYRKSRQTVTIAVARKILTAVWYLMRGYATDLLTDSHSLRIKLTKVALAIGKELLEQMKFKSTKEFVESKILLITDFT